MSIKPVSDLYLITYEGGIPYKSTRDAKEAVDAIRAGFKVEEFVSLENYRAAMLQAGTFIGEGTIQAGNSPVFPDGWQVEAEKLAEMHGMSFVLFRHGEAPQCADPTKVVISFTDKGLGHDTQPQNAPQNIPEIIPNELIAAVNRLLDSNGSRGCYSAIKCYDAHIEVERLLAAARQEDANALIPLVSRNEQEVK